MSIVSSIAQAPMGMDFSDIVQDDTPAVEIMIENPDDVVVGIDGLEIDLYGGYGGEITPDLSYDLNLATYIYPGADDGWNGSEAAVKLTYQFASIKYVRGLGDYDGNNKVVLGAQMAVTDSLSVSANYHITNNNRPKGTVVAVSYDMGNALTASATISGTDGDEPSDKTRLVFGLSKGF